MAEKPNILIAVPAYGGSVSVGGTLSLSALSRELGRQGIEFSTIAPEINGIDSARNFIASACAGLGRFTHCLMTDQDMAYPTPAILKMLEAKKDVIGCAAPRRVWNGSISFNVSGVRGSGGIRDVDFLGTGIILISTAAIRMMIETKKLRVERKHHYGASGYSGPLYGMFDRISLPSTELLGEDHSFCIRWRELCGGKIFAVVDEEISHTDSIVHSGRLTDHETATTPREVFQDRRA